MIKLLNNRARVSLSQIRIFLIGMIISAPSLVYSLELHNLELVLEIPEPDTSYAGIAAFGIALASGDVNGDGFSDIIVGGGEFGEDNCCVCIYYGSETPDAIPDVILMNGYYFGGAVGVGDVNNDGYDDVVVAGGKEGGNVFFGGNPMDSLPDLAMFLTIEPKDVVVCGNLNGDEYDDWAIGQMTWEGGRGKVIVYFGDSIPDTIPDVILRGEDGTSGNFGNDLASGFDVNNDGYDDLFISASGYGAYQGKAYIYYGGDPMDTIPDVEMLGQCPLDFFGNPCALVPDLTGDGFDDACVGEPFDAVHDTVFTYWGSNPMDNGIDLIFSGEYSYSQFGYAVGGVEINKDSLGDLGIGSDYYPYPYDTLLNGKVYVYLGRTSLDTVVDAWAVGADTQTIGMRIASAGDIDGDGIDEIMFSNYASPKLKKVWVCKYTGPGIEESDHKLQIASCRLEVYPNPFVKQTVICYSLFGNRNKVKIEIYDVSGRLIKKLLDKKQKTGQYEVKWNGKDKKGKLVASGVYVFKLKVESSDKVHPRQEIIKTKKMLFLRN